MLPQAQADAPPVWSMPQFAQAVLGASLDKASAAAASASPSCTMASLLESLELCEKLLVSLHGTSTVPIIRAAATKVAAAFKKCVELCAHMQQVKDLEAFYSLLAPFVARIKALEPGGLVVVPAGWRGGLVMLVLHCDAPDAFTLSLVSVAEGLGAHHPQRLDPATGSVQYHTPLVLREVPA